MLSEPRGERKDKHVPFLNEAEDIYPPFETKACPFLPAADPEKVTLTLIS